MKKNQRRIEGVKGSGYGHYHFHVVYPSGREKWIRNVPDAPLYDKVYGHETGLFSTTNEVWQSISRLIKYH